MHCLSLLQGLALIVVVASQSCGPQNNGALCPTGQCCSQYGYCGTTSDFCLTSQRCQSQCVSLVALLQSSLSCIPRFRLMTGLVRVVKYSDSNEVLKAPQRRRQQVPQLRPSIPAVFFGHLRPLSLTSTFRLLLF